MSSIKLRWTIEYWNDTLKKVECFSNEDGTWEESPKDNVTYVYIQRFGKRPYAREDKLYTQIVSGIDNYFLIEKNGIAYFGGWNDEGRPCTNNKWYSDGRIESKMISKRPEGIPDKIVKLGVWVNEPWAKKLGITESAKRSIKGCLDSREQITKKTNGCNCYG